MIRRQGCVLPNGEAKTNIEGLFLLDLAVSIGELPDTHYAFHHTLYHDADFRIVHFPVGGFQGFALRGIQARDFSAQRVFSRGDFFAAVFRALFPVSYTHLTLPTTPYV